MLRVVVVTALLALFVGCGKSPAREAASNREGTIGLMDQVAKAPDYPPPAHGRLSERQIEMYLAVRDRELRIREAAQGDPAGLVTAGLRAAQELGHNPKEFQWVRERVLEARAQTVTRALKQQVARSRESLMARLELEKRAAASAAERAEIERRIGDLRSSAASSKVDPAGEYNSRLLARYRERFARVEEDEPGEQR